MNGVTHLEKVGNGADQVRRGGVAEQVREEQLARRGRRAPLGRHNVLDETSIATSIETLARLLTVHTLVPPLATRMFAIFAREFCAYSSKL